MKIAFIGEELVFKPFLALGQEVYGVKEPAEARQVLSTLNIKDYALIVLTPEVAEVRQEFSGPIFLVLPGLKNQSSGQQKLISEAVRRATGRAI